MNWQVEIEVRLNDVFLELVIDEHAPDRLQAAGRPRPGAPVHHPPAPLRIHPRRGRRPAPHPRGLPAGTAGRQRLGLRRPLRSGRRTGLRPPRAHQGPQEGRRLSGNCLQDPDEGRLPARGDGDDYRFRISPVIEVLLTVERVYAFREAIRVDDGVPPDTNCSDGLFEGEKDNTESTVDGDGGELLGRDDPPRRRRNGWCLDPGARVQGGDLAVERGGDDRRQHGQAVPQSHMLSSRRSTRSPMATAARDAR